MRLCAAPLCDEAATVWFHGAYCGFHALRRFGRVPAELAKIELSRRSTGGMAAPSVRPGGGDAAVTEATPSVVAASAPSLEDAGLDWTDAEFLALLEGELA